MNTCNQSPAPIDTSCRIFENLVDSVKVTAQDLGQPSPVPYSLMIRQPSADIDTAGKESIQATSTHKELKHAAAAAEQFAPIDGLKKFIQSAFDDYGAYRLEIVVGDISIKVYKHPNN